MNRKGQYYMLLALLLIVYLVASRISEAKTPTPPNSFRQLYENYMTESVKVMNSGIYDGNLTARFSNFTTAFLEYSRSRSPEFTLVYLLADRELVTVDNRLKETVNVSTSTQSFLVVPGNSTTVSNPQNLTIYLAGAPYQFSFNETTELKVIFKKQEKKEVLVHVESS